MADTEWIDTGDTEWIDTVDTEWVGADVSASSDGSSFGVSLKNAIYHTSMIEEEDRKWL